MLYRLGAGEFRFTIGGLILYSRVVWFFSTLSIIVIFPVWLYKFHHDLTLRFNGYPIKPWQTILWYIIPWYSIWGILKLWKTLTDSLLSEEDENFEPQPYQAIDPRYKEWVSSYIFSHYKEFKKYQRISLGFHLLKIFVIFEFIWYGIILLPSLGFGHVINLLAPSLILLFHNILLDLPVYGWMPGFPSFEDILLKAVFIILFLNLLIQFVKTSQKIVIKF